MDEKKFSDSDILDFALQEGIIDLSSVQEQLEMKRRKDLLEKHTFKIWQGANGKWYTYIPDEQKGRIQKERTSKEAIESVIVEYWRQEEENPTVKDIFAEWNDRRLMLGKISEPTHLRNQQTFKRHYTFLEKKRVRSITPDVICDFLEEEIADKNLTAKGFSNLKSLTRGILKRAKKRGFISWSIEESLDDMDLSDRAFKKS